MNNIKLKNKLVVEFLVTTFLLAAGVSSGIMGEKLSQGILGIALLENSIAAALTP